MIQRIKRADVFGARVPLVVGGIASVAVAAWGYTAWRRSRRPGTIATRERVPSSTVAEGVVFEEGPRP